MISFAVAMRGNADNTNDWHCIPILYKTLSNLRIKFPPELHLQNFFLITFIEFFKFVSTHGLNTKVRYVTHKVAH